MGGISVPCRDSGDALIRCRRHNRVGSRTDAYAVAHGFIVLTHDLDFGAILAANRGNKPSVMQIRSDSLSPDVIGSAVVAALRSAEAELETGALVSVVPGRARLRILPLEPS